ncbi:MAG: TlpA family protein disulfide reductase [Spirochaetaceae bacterium]|nr:MAG: TlpA family protein disulfide reductase [Spirochaetaceae bacterium]
MTSTLKSAHLLGIALLIVGMFLGGPLSAQDWRDVPLRDVTSGRTFRISDFEGKPVLLESFAVWCPVCSKQQKEIQELHQEIGEQVISISIDVDPNEDEDLVRDHASRNGFSWLYAIAPPELIRALIDEFGTAIVAAPSSPIVLICEDDDQEARLLKRGVKRADTLREEIQRGCSS